MIINKNTVISIDTAKALMDMGGKCGKGACRVIITQEVVNYLQTRESARAMEIVDYINETLLSDTGGVSLQYMNWILRSLLEASIIVRTKIDSGETLTLDNGKTIPLIITLFSIN